MNDQTSLLKTNPECYYIMKCVGPEIKGSMVQFPQYRPCVKILLQALKSIQKKDQRLLTDDVT